MAIVDELNSDNADNVSGANPLGNSGSQQQQAYDDAATNSAEGSTGSEITSAPNQQQSGSTGSKSKKASSGMFTNIQNYVNKNKPQAQKMAGTVKQDFSKQASAINEVASQKEQEKKDLFKSNVGKIDTAKAGAETTINAITGVNNKNTYTAPTVEQRQQYSNLLENKVSTLTDVTPLNLVEQNRKSAALAQLAKGTNTEEGRRNLLADTFKKRGNYGRGLSALDQLVTVGDKGARDTLIEGTKAEAKGLGESLTGIQGEFNKALQGQKDTLSGLNEFATNLGTEGITGVEGKVQSLVDMEKEKRKFGLEKLEQSRDQYGNVIGKDLLKSINDMGAYWKSGTRYLNTDANSVNNMFGKLAAIYSKQKGDLGLQDNSYNAARDAVLASNKYSGEVINGYEGEAVGSARMLADTVDYLNIFGDSDKARSDAKSKSQQSTINSIVALQDFMKNIQEGAKGKASGIDSTINKLSDMTDINSSSVATDNQRNQINAIKELLNRQDLLTKKDYTSSTDLNKIIQDSGYSAPTVRNANLNKR